MFSGKPQYEIETDLTPYELSARLKRHTLSTEKLARVRTDKEFIGDVDEEGFTIIQSTRLGMLSIFTGVITEREGTTIIEVNAKVHTAFIRLYTLWAVLMAMFLVFIYIKGPHGDSASTVLIEYFIAIIFFRIFIQVFYLIARNRGIKKLIEITSKDQPV